MSAGGVVRLHALANVPGLGAASSLCFGSTGMWSSRRMPGADGAWNMTTTVGELERVRQMVRGLGPAVGEPRLDVPGALVDADEAGLGELGDEVGTDVVVDEAVERLRVGAERGDDGAAGAQGRGFLDRRSAGRRGGGSRAIRRRSIPTAGGRNRPRRNQRDHAQIPNGAYVSGQKLSWWPKTWPVISCRSVDDWPHFACKITCCVDSFR